MIFVPTIKQLKDQIIIDLEAGLNIQIPLIGRFFVNVYASVLAAKLKILYLVGKQVNDNVYPDTCDTETLYRYGLLRLGRLPFESVAAVYTVDITTNGALTIPVSTTFKSDDDSLNAGAIFVVTQPYVVSSSGTHQIKIRALTGGLNSQLNIADTLTITAPLLVLNDIASVVSVDTDPLAAQSIEAYREQVIQSFRLEAKGGSGADYRLWSFDIQSIRRVYPYAVSGQPNHVNLYVETTTGLASSSVLSDLQDVIEFNPDTTRPLHERGRIPITVAQVNYISITQLPVIVIINGLNVDTTAIRANINTAITDFLYLIRPHVASAETQAEENDTLSVIRLSSAVQNAIGSSNFFDSIIVLLNNNPVNSSVAFTNGDIPTLNTLLYS